MKKIFLLLSVCLFSSATFSAESNTFKVGVLCWSMNISGQVAMRQGLENEAKKINRNARKGRPGVSLIIRVAGDGDAGIENQILQMKEMITAHVDLIIVQPTDNAALVEPLRLANAAGIPVVAYDQYINGGTLAAYRASDNYQAGYLDGEYIASLHPEGRKLKIVLVEYPHVSSTVERVNGFLDALEHYKRPVTILKSYTAVEPVSGKKAGLQILKDFPARGSVDIVFTVNDGGGIAVVDVLAGAGRNEITVATIDGDSSSVENIRRRRLTVIDAAQFCGPLGGEAMKAGYDILCGKAVPFHALVPVFPVTMQTLSRYPGWRGPIPPTLKKPWKSDVPLWSGALKIIKQ